jgi:acyl transferase domain-containing protein
MALSSSIVLYTSPYFYQNLAAILFLNTTGACKPFDTKADRYCHREGAGLILLKKLSDAIADGDNILGMVAGTAMNQNYNSTYITVPHGQSQVELYQKVSNLAGVDTARVSYIEAHGTVSRSSLKRVS